MAQEKTSEVVSDPEPPPGLEPAGTTDEEPVEQTKPDIPAEYAHLEMEEPEDVSDLYEGGADGTAESGLTETEEPSGSSEGDAGEDGAVEGVTGEDKAEPPVADITAADDELCEIAETLIGLRKEDAKKIPGNVLEDFLRLKGQEIEAQSSKGAPGDNGEQAASSGERKPPELPTFELDPETHDQEFVKLGGKLTEAFKAQQDYYQGELADTKQTLGFLYNALARVSGAMFNEDVDRWFGSLGEEYADLFGQGSLAELDPASEQYRNRVELVQQRHRLAQGYAGNRGGRMPSEAKLRKQALHATFGDKIEAVASGKVRAKMDDRKHVRTVPPTRRRTKTTLSPEQQAIVDVGRKMRDWNADKPDPEDGLLD